MKSMSLHPQCQAVLDLMAARPGKPFEQMTHSDILEMRILNANGFGMAGPPEPVARIENRTIPGPAGPVPIRCYWPTEASPLPVLFYFHGGGFVFGSLNGTDESCRVLANRSGALVISVDYRLAPEHPFPAAPEDCYAALNYVASQAAEFGADPSRIALCGDSAGGNLAAATSLMTRDRKGPAVAFQALVYPCIDPLDQSPSMKEFSEGHFLTAAGMEWFWKQYADPRHTREPYHSPAYATDLTGLPPTFVLTAGCDPLRDQGELYAQKLLKSGIHAWAKRYDGMIHGFIHMGGVIDQGKEALDYLGQAVAKMLRTARAAA